MMKIIDQQKTSYFERIASMNLSTPRLIGFGIHDERTIQQAFEHANGAIIGSAFIKHMGNSSDPIVDSVHQFMQQIGLGDRSRDRVGDRIVSSN